MAPFTNAIKELHTSNGSDRVTATSVNDHTQLDAPTEFGSVLMGTLPGIRRSAPASADRRRGRDIITQNY